MRIFAFLVFALVAGTTSAQAQVQFIDDNWGTLEECLAADGALFYRPTITVDRPIFDRNTEVVRGLDQNYCVDMEVPDRLSDTGRRWVRSAIDMDYIWDLETRLPVRMAACNNRVYQMVPIPGPEPVVIKGIDGRDGIDGKDGIDGRDGIDGKVVYVPPPTPQSPVRYSDPGQQAFTVGLSAVFGNAKSVYTDPVPDSGDVPQRHSFRALVPYVRYDQAETGGLFVEVSTYVLGSAKNLEFQDLNGTWNDKNRDTDDSKDERLELRGGWKFPVGDVMTVAPFAGWSRWCLPCEEYNAQGADTTTKRIFQGPQFGAEAAFAPSDSRFNVKVGGTFSKLSRISWTKQFYPGVDFPRVDHPDESGFGVSFKAGVDVQLTGPFYANAAYEWLGISSHRPENFAADERTNVNAFSVGISYKIGG